MDVGLTKQEELLAKQKAREESQKTNLQIAGGGAALWGGAKAGKYFGKDVAAKEVALHAKIGLRLARNKANTASGDRHYTNLLKRNALSAAKKKSVMANLVSAGMIGKGMAIGGGLAAGVNHLSRAADSGDQGIDDNKTVSGDRGNWLLGSGLALTGLGAYGVGRIGKKIQNASVTDQGLAKIKKMVLDPENPVLSEAELFGKEEGLVTDEMRHIHSGLLKVKSSTTAEESGLAQKELEKRMLEYSKKTEVKPRDFKAQSIYAGLRDAGGVATGTSLLNSSGASAYSQEKEKILEEKEGLLKKKAFLTSMAIGAGVHAGQNKLFNLATQTEKGRSKSAKFLVDRFSEGYTGRSIKSKASDVVAKANFKYNPAKFFRSKKEHALKSRSLGEGVSGGITGVGYHLMPEAEVAAKEARHLGATFKKNNVDLKSISDGDKEAMRHLANGDINIALPQIAKSPVMLDVLHAALPSANREKLMHTLGRISIQDPNSPEMLEATKILKSTNIQPIMKSISNHLDANGLTKAPVTGNLASKTKGEQNGYNYGHAGLALTEPVAAFLNGVKRVVGGDKLRVSESDGALKAGLKNLNNISKDVASGVVTKLPMIEANVKGMAGVPYKETEGTEFRKKFFSPAIEKSVEDTQKISQMSKIIASGDMKKVAPEVLAKLDSLVESGYEKIKKYEGARGKIRAVKDTFAATTKEMELKEERNQALSGIASQFNPSEVVRKAGQEKIKKASGAALEKSEDQTDLLLDRASGKITSGIDVGVEETSDLENKYKKWAFPGAVAGTAAISTPAMLDIRERNKEAEKKQKLEEKKEEDLPKAALYKSFKNIKRLKEEAGALDEQIGIHEESSKRNDLIRSRGLAEKDKAKFNADQDIINQEQKSLSSQKKDLLKRTEENNSAVLRDTAFTGLGLSGTGLAAYSLGNKKKESETKQ